MKRYRVGSSWGVTIIETDCIPEDRSAKHPSDRLMATAQTPEDAQTIVQALNRTAHQGGVSS